MAKRSTARASPEIEKLKAANLAYYKALSARDIRAMAQVWTCAGNNILIAPPENPHEHIGWTAIKRNWERYWPTFDQFSVSMKVNKINISGPVAWVHGIEKTRRRKKTGEVSGSRNFGTNIFVNRNGHWLMVFHQAAEIPENPDLMPCSSDCSKSAFWEADCWCPSSFCPGNVQEVRSAVEEHFGVNRYTHQNRRPWSLIRANQCQRAGEEVLLDQSALGLSASTTSVRSLRTRAVTQRLVSASSQPKSRAACA